MVTKNILIKNRLIRILYYVNILVVISLALITLYFFTLNENYCKLGKFENSEYKCISYLAEINADESYCEKIRSESPYLATCLIDVAAKKKLEISVCDKITSEMLRELCIQEIRG